MAASRASGSLASAGQDRCYYNALAETINGLYKAE